MVSTHGEGESRIMPWSLLGRNFCLEKQVYNVMGLVSRLDLQKTLKKLAFFSHERCSGEIGILFVTFSIFLYLLSANIIKMFLLEILYLKSWQNKDHDVYILNEIASEKQLCSSGFFIMRCYERDITFMIK